MNKKTKVKNDCFREIRRVLSYTWPNRDAHHVWGRKGTLCVDPENIVALSREQHASEHKCQSLRTGIRPEVYEASTEDYKRLLKGYKRCQDLTEIQELFRAWINSVM